MTKKQQILTKKRIASFGIVILALYLIALINPFTGPAFRHPYYVVYCGQKPIITSSIMNKAYYTPDMKSYRTPGIASELFCTEDEAKANGYTKSRAQ